MLLFNKIYYKETVTSSVLKYFKASYDNAGNTEIICMTPSPWMEYFTFHQVSLIKIVFMTYILIVQGICI